jgi:hypothetical protein
LSVDRLENPVGWTDLRLAIKHYKHEPVLFFESCASRATMPACCGGGGGREKDEKISATHKWDYINLSDFKSTSCFTPLSYGVLYITLIVSVAVYIADIFVAVNLLLFNKWAGQIKPWLDLKYTRWIFAGCIILSLVLLVYRWIRAIRAIRTGGIAQSYLDPLAVGLQSIRVGERGRGYRRFLVFAELTKSKKGVEYIALFTYFSFEAWIRVVFAEGPRKVINAMTLVSIFQADIVPVGGHAAPKGDSPIAQFFINFKLYAEGNNLRAAITFSMIFTLITWVFAALSLIASCLFYLLFLWHHIPSQDGGLRKYCKRKADSRLQKIVDAKVKKALAKEDKKLGLAASKATDVKRQPTLPVLASEDVQAGRAARSSFGSTGSYNQDVEREGGAGHDHKRPPLLARMTTNSSTTSANSYASNAPLMGAAGSMGSAPVPRAYSPAPSSHFSSVRGPPHHGQQLNRSFTGQTFSSQSTARGGRPNPGPGPPRRQNTGISSYSADSHNVVSSLGSTQPGALESQRSNGRFTPGPLARQGTGPSGYTNDDYFSQTSYPRSEVGFVNHSHNGRNSPAPPRERTVQEFEMTQPSYNTTRSAQGGGGRFLAYNPTTSASTSIQRDFSGPPPRSFSSSPSRNFSSSSPMPPLPQRSETTPPRYADNPSYDPSIYDSYR